MLPKGVRCAHTRQQAAATYERTVPVSAHHAPLTRSLTSYALAAHGALHFCLESVALDITAHCVNNLQRYAKASPLSQVVDTTGCYAKYHYVCGVPSGLFVLRVARYVSCASRFKVLAHPSRVLRTPVPAPRAGGQSASPINYKKQCATHMGALRAVCPPVPPQELPRFALATAAKRPVQPPQGGASLRVGGGFPPQFIASDGATRQSVSQGRALARFKNCEALLVSLKRFRTVFENLDSQPVVLRQCAHALWGVLCPLHGHTQPLSTKVSHANKPTHPQTLRL